MQRPQGFGPFLVPHFDPPRRALAPALRLAGGGSGRQILFRAPRPLLLLLLDLPFLLNKMGRRGVGVTSFDSALIEYMYKFSLHLIHARSGSTVRLFPSTFFYEV